MILNRINSRINISILCLLIIPLLSACSDFDDSKYTELSWDDLKPPQEEADLDDENAYLKSLEVIDNRYLDDYVADDGFGAYGGIPRQPFSSGIVPEVNGTSIRLPGFIVPLEFDSENLITEFFLVPYFGACYHKPPPPPNQTIYVTSPTPIEFESIYDPVWVMGMITTKQAGNDIATAAYSMDLHHLKPYEENW